MAILYSKPGVVDKMIYIGSDSQDGPNISAGDFNADGYADLAVGDPRWFLSRGAVWVLYGGPQGVDTSRAVRFDEDTPGIPGTGEPQDAFGDALAAADLNRDGRTGVAIGASGEDIGTAVDAGMVTVLYGGATGLTTSGAVSIGQSTAGVPDAAEGADFFGMTLAAGDVNGDGYADLAVGSPFETIGDRGTVGSITLLRGSPSGVSGSGATSIHGASFGNGPTWLSALGRSLALADVNGDFLADVIGGAPDSIVNGVGGAGAIAIIHGTGPHRRWLPSRPDDERLRPRRARGLARTEPPRESIIDGDMPLLIA